MTGLEKLLRWQSMRGGISTQDATATGNPATFTTTLVRPLKSCVASFSPVQTGSGTPSPDNVQPISGWTGLIVYHSTEDTSNPDEIAVEWQTEAGTVYGGTVDLVSGVLTVTHYSFAGDAAGLILERNSVSDTVVVGKIVLSTNNFPNAYSNSSCISNRFSTTIPAGTAGRMVSTTTTIWFVMPRQDFGDSTDSSAIKQWLVDHPTIWVYKMSTVQTVQLTTRQIMAIAGTNKIWSNADENVSVTYTKKG